MNLYPPLRIALRLVFRRDRRIASHLKGTVLGISLSLVPLILVMVVSSGLIKGITTRFLELGTFHLQVRSYGLDDRAWSETAGLLKKETGVTGAFPVVQGLGMLYSPGGRAGVTVKGFSADMWENDDGFRKYMIVEEGDFDLSDPENIVITRGTADSLNVSPGDKIKLLSSRTSSSGQLFLRPSFFTVRGICSTGYYELDAMTAYVPYSRADSIFREEGTRYIGLKTEDPYRGINTLKRSLGEVLDGEWYLMSWQELQRPMYASFQTSRNLILLIMALIVLVATLNVSATLSMLVLENQEQIAILKATGSTSAQIGAIFLFAGLSTGIAGVVPGIALGLLLAVNINSLIALMENSINLLSVAFDTITPFLSFDFRVELFDSSYYLDTIPVELDPVVLSGAVFFTLFVAVFAALVPAGRAASIRPLEILKKR